MNNTILESFHKEVNRNRSALLNLGFKSCWNFLGLNPEVLHAPGVESCREWFEQVYGHKFLDEILSTTNENEIFIHLESNLCDKDLTYAFENLSLKLGYQWNTTHPFLSKKYFHCGQNYRMTLIHPSLLSDDRPRIFLRRLKSEPLSLASYGNQELLSSFVLEKKNILISGGTGSGKTTLLQNLLNKVTDEHMVVLEDTQELNFNDKNVSQLLSNEDNSLVDYCSYAMRMSPDRIILGEMRGAEVLPLTLALNTGHRGFMTTVHANSAVSALKRLRTLLEYFSPVSSSAFSLICQNIDIVIHMENKKIREIIEVRGLDGEQPLFENLLISA